MHEPHHTKRQQWGRRARTLAIFLALGFILNIVVAWGSMGAARAGWPNTKPRVQLGDANAHTRHIFVNRSDTVLLSRVTVQSQFTHAPVDLERSRQTFARRGGPTVGDAHTIIPRWTRWTLDDITPDNAPITLPPNAQAAARNRIPTTLVPTEVYREFVAVGLPFRSIISTTTDPRVMLPSSVWITYFAEVANPGAIVVSFWPPAVTIGGKGYPLRPVWPGTFLNTAIYAALLFALSRLPVALRRRRRRRRNQCAACGYSLVGLTSPACPECGLLRPTG